MKLSKKDIRDLLKDSDVYRCTSKTCSDNGGVCVLIIPDMFCAPADGLKGCSYPDDFNDDDCECKCKWKKIS